VAIGAQSKRRVKDGKRSVALFRGRTKLVLEGNFKNGGLYENGNKTKWEREFDCDASVYPGAG
jgi:hypothetical protein